MSERKSADVKADNVPAMMRGKPKMEVDIDYQELSDLAYKEVPKDLRLPPGARLHEDPDRIKRWQFLFGMYCEVADLPELVLEAA